MTLLPTQSQLVHSAFVLAETLRTMNVEGSLPRDLPGRYGRAIADLERLLTAADAVAVVAGGWAVWRHGYAGRVTQDVDIVVAQEKIEKLKEMSGICGFDFFDAPTEMWPKLLHRTTLIEIDLLPENGIPGTPSRPAPVPIGHPSRYEAVAGTLRYIPLAGLVELKIGAGRAKDIADLIELIKHHRDALPMLLDRLGDLHESYPDRLEQLILQANEEASNDRRP